jgi:hypothetical protein
MWFKWPEYKIYMHYPLPRGPSAISVFWAYTLLFFFLLTGLVTAATKDEYRQHPRHLATPRHNHVPTSTLRNHFPPPSTRTRSRHAQISRAWARKWGKRDEGTGGRGKRDEKREEVNPVAAKFRTVKDGDMPGYPDFTVTAREPLSVWDDEAMALTTETLLQGMFYVRVPLSNG